MAAEKQQNLQDVFLNHVRKNKVPVTVFLINGVKLQGVISSFDNFCLLLRRDGHVQLVYKHAVSTVMPSAAVRLYEPSADEQASRRVDRSASRIDRAPRIGPARRELVGRGSCAPSTRRRPAAVRPTAALAEAVGLAPRDRPRGRRAASSCRCGRRCRRRCSGSGKVEEIGLALEAEPAELVVVDARADAGPAAQSRDAPGRPRSSTGPA